MYSPVCPQQAAAEFSTAGHLVTVVSPRRKAPGTDTGRRQTQGQTETETKTEAEMEEETKTETETETNDSARRNRVGDGDGMESTNRVRHGLSRHRTSVIVPAPSAAWMDDPLSGGP